MTASPPSDGERRAASGLGNQYRVAARLIYGALRRGELTAIRVADADAGRVDDIQIVRPGRCDAYQVKWSQYPASLTFNGLTKPEKDKPSLIRQLADGWKRLSASRSGERVVVHLLTNDYPSTADAVPAGLPVPTPKHFAAFVQQAWVPAHGTPSGQALSIPPAWRIGWDALQTASGLTTEEFDTFVRDCELDLGFNLVVASDLSGSEPLGRERDEGQLAKFLLDAAGGAERVTELSRAELVRRLGWERRISPVNKHEWPRCDFPYRPVNSTAAELEQVLGSQSGGYAVVLGTPGSGKSTLLSEALRGRPERVVRYFAYVPDAQGGPLRGESAHFLLDVVLALEDQGVRVGSAPTMDRNMLLPKLHAQLSSLGDEYRASGRKTILLVDGLDHIQREQSPDRSLLADLPPPDAVPDGVLIVLGSQTDELDALPSSVQSAVRDPARRVQMQPLGRDAVLDIVAQSRLPVDLNTSHRERVFALSEGHPLALTYLLNRLTATTKAEDIDAVLNSETRYTGRIETQYDAYWRSLERDQDLKRLLGLLARLRRGYDVRWVESWAGESVVETLERTAGHYFRVEGDSRYFLHNSFRLYLESRTAERPRVGRDDERDRQLHQALAAHCEASSRSEWKWEELYHRGRAGDHTVVLNKATQVYFREQANTLRPLEAIQADIQSALVSAAVQRDPVALARLVLAYTECANRQYHTDDVPLASVLLRAGRAEQAVQHARNGNRLLIGRNAALKLSIELTGTGHGEESRRLFTLAEPYDLLNSTEPVNEVSHQGVRSLLESWAAAAAHFRTSSEIITVARQLRWRIESYHNDDPEVASRSLQNNVLVAAGREYIATARWSDLERLVAAFDAPGLADRSWELALRLEAATAVHESGDAQAAEKWLQSAIQLAVGEVNLALDTRVWLAEVVARVQRDYAAARRLLGDYSLPPREAKQHVERKWDEMTLRFRIARILYLSGENTSPLVLVPNASGGGIAAVEVEFERDMCRLARLSAWAWAGVSVPATEVLNHVVGSLRRLHDPIDRPQWAQMRHAALRRMRPDMYRLLIGVVGSHGRDALAALRQAIESEWRDRPDAWYDALRRTVTVEFDRAGADRSWAHRQLECLESGLLNGHDNYERVRVCQEQAEAYISLGHPERGLEWLYRLVRTAAGIGFRKDNQMQSWAAWLGRAVSDDPGSAAGRIAWFARAIAGLRGRTEGAHWSASEMVLSLTAQWSPGRAVILMEWLFDQEVLSHEDAVFVFLRRALQSRPIPFDLAFEFTAAILPVISACADSNVVDELLAVAAQQGGRERVEAAAQRLWYAVRVYSLPSTRVSWYECIADSLRDRGGRVETLGIEPPRESRVSTSDTDPFKLKLSDERSLTGAEALREADSAEKLIALVDAASPQGYFRWDAFLAKSGLQFTRTEALAVAEKFGSVTRSADVLAILSQRLLALGDRDGAWEVGLKALTASQPNGWLRHYDGGSRLVALRALAAIDPSRARQIAFDTFAQDMRGKATFLDSLAKDIADVWPLFVDTLPVRQLWPEIEEYLQALFAGTDLPADAPALECEPADDSPEASLVELLRAHVLHPASAVTQAAQRCLSSLLMAEYPGSVALVKRMLAEDDPSVTPVIQVLYAVCRRDTRYVEAFRDPVLAHINSGDAHIAQAARSVARGAGWGFPALQSVVTPLPATYTLIMPNQVSMGGSVLNDLGDGAVLQPFYPLLDRISELTNVDPTTLRARAIVVMRQLGQAESWSTDGEERFRAFVKAGGLDLLYRGPGLTTARRAVNHVVGELARSGSVREPQMSRLLELVRWHDPEMLLATPSVRPSCVTGLQKGDQSYLSAAWVERASEGVVHVATAWIDGGVILAEDTTLRNLAWESPSELRNSAVVVGRVLLRGGEEWGWPVLEKCPVTEYPRREWFDDPLPFAVQNLSIGSDTPGEHWLGLNPAVGNVLGWTHDPSGLFRWRGPAGEVMAESVWWVDGPTTLGPPHHDDEVGEGWMVVATQQGVAAIRKQFPGLTRLSRVIRHRREDGQRQLSQATRAEAV